MGHMQNLFRSLTFLIFSNLFISLISSPSTLGPFSKLSIIWSNSIFAYSDMAAHLTVEHLPYCPSVQTSDSDPAVPISKMPSLSHPPRDKPYLTFKTQQNSTCSLKTSASFALCRSPTWALPPPSTVLSARLLTYLPQVTVHSRDPHF